MVDSFYLLLRYREWEAVEFLLQRRKAQISVLENLIK